MNIFDQNCKKYDAWYDISKYAYLSEIEAIKKVLPSKGKGLEVGVGTGRFAAPLGIQFGIDPSRKMLEIAQKRGVDVKCGKGEDLPFNDATFDYVAIIIAICFVKDPLKVLRETQRVLRNHGKIIIGIVDKSSFLGEFYQNKKSIFYKKAHFFNVNEIINLLKTAKFSQFIYYQTIFQLPDKIGIIEKPRKGFGKGGFVVVSGQKKLN